MKKRIYMLIAASFVFTVMLSCTKSGDTDNGTEEGSGTEPPAIEEKDYPDGISVEEFTEEFTDGKKCLGFIATIDFAANSGLKFNVYYTVPKKTPSEIYASFPGTKGKAKLVINGGYFSGSTSMSLAVIDGNVKCTSKPTINWPNDENYERTVYPVRSAFGMMSDGTFEAQWVYCTNTASKEHYAFPSAMGNDEKTQTFLDTPPSADTPGAFPWTPQEAIGGGPRLVENGKNVAVANYWAEVLDSGGTAGTSRQPRTAIGVTADNKVIIIVCDGRNMRGSAGYTLAELADKFIELGATDAINLDGGGSSAIVGKDGQVLNRPSDSGDGEEIVERKVVTSVVISETE